MKPDGRGIAHIAPILPASLLLHLVVILALAVIVKKEANHRVTPPDMAVEYLEQGKNKRQPDMATVRQVTQPLQRQAVTSTAADKPEPSRRPATAVQQNPPMQSAASTVPAPAAVHAETGLSGNAATTAAGTAGGNKMAFSGVVAENAKTAAGAPAAKFLQRRETYQAQLKRLIEAHKRYPLAARRSGKEGVCQRRFALRRDGTLKRVEELSSCGHTFLDDAATHAISAVGTFPPLPDDFTGAEETFTITMIFTLARQ
jgi:protein TonB